MRKERNSSEKIWAEEQKVIRKQTREDVKKVRPILEKDPDWPLVSGLRKAVTQEDDKRQRMALTRLTKKAVNLLFPEYKALARYDRGTASHWVNVNIVTQEKILDATQGKIKERAENMLEAVGLRYGSYYSDYGTVAGDDWHSCLHVGVNVIGWEHY